MIRCGNERWRWHEPGRRSRGTTNEAAKSAKRILKPGSAAGACWAACTANSSAWASSWRARRRGVGEGDRPVLQPDPCSSRRCPAMRGIVSLALASVSRLSARSRAGISSVSEIGLALPPLQRIVPLSLTSSVSFGPCPVRVSRNRSGDCTSRPQPARPTHARAASAASTRRADSASRRIDHDRGAAPPRIAAAAEAAPRRRSRSPPGRRRRTGCARGTGRSPARRASSGAVSIPGSA